DDAPAGGATEQAGGRTGRRVASSAARGGGAGANRHAGGATAPPSTGRGKTGDAAHAGSTRSLEATVRELTVPARRAALRHAGGQARSFSPACFVRILLSCTPTEFSGGWLL